MLVSFFALVVLSESLVYGNVTVRGRIHFQGGRRPNYIPDGSILTVKLQDAHRMDVSSIDLGTAVHEIRDYKNTNVLGYEIKEAKRPIHGQEASLSAVLNTGWKPNEDEWIRAGDYLNEAMHHVQINDGKNEYNDINIELSQYSYDGEDEL